LIEGRAAPTGAGWGKNTFVVIHEKRKLGEKEIGKSSLEEKQPLNCKNVEKSIVRGRTIEPYAVISALAGVFNLVGKKGRPAEEKTTTRRGGKESPAAVRPGKYKRTGVTASTPKG